MAKPVIQCVKSYDEIPSMDYCRIRQFLWLVKNPDNPAEDGLYYADCEYNLVKIESGGGDVISVNGKTGEVVLNAGDVDAYTKEEIDIIISQIKTAVFDGPYPTVGDIPTPYQDNYIYLVGTGEPYSMYVLIDGTLTNIGSTSIDLTNYYTKSEVDALINGVNPGGLEETIDRGNTARDDQEINIGEDPGEGGFSQTKINNNSFSINMNEQGVQLNPSMGLAVHTPFYTTEAGSAGFMTSDSEGNSGHLDKGSLSINGSDGDFEHADFNMILQGGTPYVSGSDNVKQAFLDWLGISTQAIKESMYPLGSMFTSFTDSRNPSEILGFGTWEEIQGRFIRGVPVDNVGAGVGPGERGGEEQHLLVDAEIPQTSLRVKSSNKYLRLTAENRDAPTTGTLGFAMGDADSNNANNIVVRGGSGYHNNTPNFINAKIWQRVADPIGGITISSWIEFGGANGWNNIKELTLSGLHNGTTISAPSNTSAQFYQMSLAELGIKSTDELLGIEFRVSGYSLTTGTTAMMKVTSAMGGVTEQQPFSEHDIKVFGSPTSKWGIDSMMDLEMMGDFNLEASSNMGVFRVQHRIIYKKGN